MTWEIREGDVLDRLREMPDESVHCVVTSPPYWGLRDYGTAEWDGGDAACGHTAIRRGHGDEKQASSAGTSRDRITGDDCRLCGARRIDRQIGLEATPSAYLARMVEVFREVKRVLRSDGSLWLNVGDSYSSGTRKTQVAPTLRTKGHDDASGKQAHLNGFAVRPGAVEGIAGKQLLGIPWRLAFALQDDGWWLRSEIIWAKPNPMPESVTDRPTKAHEQIFLLTKSARYFYDADAIREPYNAASLSRYGSPMQGTDRNNGRIGGARQPGGEWNPKNQMLTPNPSGRNSRTVWTIATQPFSEAHFATFPEELPRRCILAGTSERGVCPECGAPWKRIVEREGEWKAQHERQQKHDGTVYRVNPGGGVLGPNTPRHTLFLGWAPTCEHAGEPVPAVVLDPFAGSGTTIMVALQLGRSGLGIELNPEYAAMARRRIVNDAPLFNSMAAAGG